MAEKNIFVASEVDELKKVLVHRPDSGIARVRPKKADELLFDDIVHLPLIQEEHDIFVSVLQAFLGEENVLYIHDLLEEMINSSDAVREKLIERIVDFEELPEDYFDLLYPLETRELVEVLISGYHEANDHIFFDPIPNFIFTRDIAVVVGDHVVVTKANKDARHRENILTRYIFYYHPRFKKLVRENRIINLNHIDVFPPSKQGEPVSIEGGDIMMVNKDYVMIGCSERTNEHSVKALRDELFKRGVVDNVVQVNIPNDRSYMHIDTIFTWVSNKHLVAFKPFVYEGLSSFVIVHRSNGEQAIYHSVKDFVLAEIDPKTEFIFSGNGISPYQEREQWTDGCNLVAIRDGVAITYDRNPKTEEAFVENGYTIISSSDFLSQVAAGKLDPATLQNTIITIPSSELSRARGGSHCMTCPLQRV